MEIDTSPTVGPSSHRLDSARQFNNSRTAGLNTDGYDYNKGSKDLEDDRNLDPITQSDHQPDSHHPTFAPSIYDDSVVDEPTLYRNTPTPNRNGRTTPGPQRYQYQPSSIDTSSYLTGTDGLPRSYHTGHSYIAVNPFLASVAQGLGPSTYSVEQGPSFPFSHTRPLTPIPPPYTSNEVYSTPPSTSKYIIAFLFDTVPRQIYLHLQLRLPALYFSRVARIFEDAELSMPDIQKMAVAAANQWRNNSTSVVHGNWDFEPSIISPPLSNLKTSWESFIDSLMREWKTLNIVSVLLLSAILTMLQIEAAAADPVTRYAALASLVCALMSLLYGCMFIIRFGTMRKAYKAAEWAEEAQKTKTLIWWNVWVLLATPSVWLSWSIIFYLTCIMSFIWRTGTTRDAILELSPQTALGPRLAITAIFTVGVIYFFLIVATFRRYEDDRARKERLLGWVEKANGYRPPSFYQQRSSLEISDYAPPPQRVSFPQPQSQSGPSQKPFYSSQSQPLHPAAYIEPSINITAPPSFSRPPPDPPIYSPSFKTVKIMDLRFRAHISNQMPHVLVKRDIQSGDWSRFISDASLAWDGKYPRFRRERGLSSEQIRMAGRSRPQDVMARFVEWWNEYFFRHRRAQVVLCQEISRDHPTSPVYALYLLDLGSPNDVVDGNGLGIAERFGSVPESLERVDVFDPPEPGNSGKKTMGKTLIYAGPHTARVHWGRGGEFARDVSPAPSHISGDSESSSSTPHVHGNGNGPGVIYENRSEPESGGEYMGGGLN